MEEIKTKGIVIKSKDFKDSDKIVTIFSLDLGLIHAKARGVKKNKAKLVFATQPFAFVEFMLIKSNGFYTIANATSIDQFYDITLDFDNYVFMLGTLEVIEKTVRENDEENELFVLLLESLKSVCYEKASAMAVFIKFMLESLKLLGFKIELEKCPCCGKMFEHKTFNFSYDFNGFICSRCANNLATLDLTQGEFAVLKNINNSQVGELKNLHFSSRENLVSVISLLLKIFRIQTDNEIVSVKQFL